MSLEFLACDNLYAFISWMRLSMCMVWVWYDVGVDYGLRGGFRGVHDVNVWCCVNAQETIDRSHGSLILPSREVERDIFS